MNSATVLVVEDNEANMVLATSVLEAWGYTVLQARTAEEGVALAREHIPALVLMDISLPGMDGLTAAGILKNDPGTGNIPVVALTAHAMMGDEERAMAAGCVGYVRKPIRIKQFSRAVAQFIEHAPTRQSLE